MGCVFEILAYDFGEDPHCCSDPYPGHCGQDLGERVGIDHRQDFCLDLRALSSQLNQLLS